MAETRKTLFHKIQKLSQLVQDIQNRQAVDAYILDDPIAEMQIEIPPQLLKYAYAPQPSNGPKEHTSSPAKPKPKERSISAKTKKLPPPNPEVVSRLYAKKAQVDSKINQLREQQTEKELKELHRPQVNDYGQLSELTPLHERVDRVLNQKEQKIKKVTERVEMERQQNLKKQGIQTEEEILIEQWQRQQYINEQRTLTAADIDQKFQKTMVAKRIKESQLQIKKAELEAKHCTFQPEINRKKTPDPELFKTSKKGFTTSEMLIQVQGTGRVEDRLIERGQKTKEKVTHHQQAPVGSFKPLLNQKSIQMIKNKEQALQSKSRSPTKYSTQKPNFAESTLGFSPTKSVVKFDSGAQTQRVQLRQEKPLPNDLAMIMNALDYRK